MFNTKLKDFMNKYPDQTVLSFAWSMYWRISIVTFIIFFIVGLLGAIID